MYVLDYLSDPNCEAASKDALTCEYRLLCSGLVYCDGGGDPSKSDASRILLDNPLLLFIVNRPLDDHPLELALEIKVPLVVEVEHVMTGPSYHHFHPDNDVANDFASLLSLLVRRLITVSGKVSESYSDWKHPLFGSGRIPMPLITRMKRISWRLQPMTIAYTLKGQELHDHNPKPKVVDRSELAELLLRLPQLENAESIVSASRLYSLALELIQTRPEISYQLLISSVETMANAVLDGFQPDENSKVEHKRPVFDLATRLGLCAEIAKNLAVEACRGEYWATRKFKQFLLDNVADSVWDEPDDLYRELPRDIMPKRENLEKKLGMIYGARSKATHLGERFPHSATFAGGPQIEVRAATQLYGTTDAFPPVIWFERVVHSALLSFWKRAVHELRHKSP